MRQNYFPHQKENQTMELLTTAELAARTKKSRRSWETLRLKGGGPSFFRIDARCVRYDWQMVLRWLDERRFTSTSEEVRRDR